MRLRLAVLFVALCVPARVWAAAPVPTCTTQQFSSTVTDHDVTLPGTVNSGDLLIVVMSIYGGNQSTASTPTSGWNELEEIDKTNQVKQAIYYKFADGSEGGGTMRVTTTVTFRAVANTCRITGAHASQVPEKSTAANGTSVNPNPPSVTASWGAEDNLFMATYAQQLTTGAASGYPTNYSLAQTSNYCGNVANCPSGGVASRALTNATDDPGTFTTPDNTNWIAQTLVIRPAAAVTGPCTFLLLGVGRACN
jgi:hypothetical protein